jgi:hypothetical protein
MTNSTIVPNASGASTSSYVISFQASVQTPIVEQRMISNQSALNMIAKYLDETTKYLRKRRLAAQ